MIFTTNKSLKAWGRVLHDEDLAQAILDRVLERGRLLRLDGPSVRTLHVNLDEAMKEDSDQEAEVVRISGKSGQNFRNPQAALINPGHPSTSPTPTSQVSGDSNPTPNGYTTCWIFFTERSPKLGNDGLGADYRSATFVPMTRDMQMPPLYVLGILVAGYYLSCT